MAHETLEFFSKSFHKNKIGNNGIHWVTTWGIGIVDEKKLWKIFLAAMPHEVEIPNRYYKKYDEIYDWLDKNSTGMWTHSQLYFVFENKEDALAFKLRWL